MGQLSELFINEDKKDRAFPMFYIKTVEDEKESKKEGRAVFKELEYVRVRTTDKTMELDCPVEESHKRRWAEHYKAFKEGSEAPIDGTPIQQWPMISEMRRMELNSLGVRSVEDLAHFPDGDIPERSNIHELKRLARDWLEEAKGLGVISSLRDRAEKSEARVADLETLLKQQASKLEVLEEMIQPTPLVSSATYQEPHVDPVINPVQVTKKKRGRPRKTQ